MTDTYEEMVTCPYDEVHNIRRGRMENHLQKCRANYEKLHPGDEKVMCPFDARHRVNKVELTYHVKYECDQKAKLPLSMMDRGNKELPGVIPASEIIQSLNNIKFDSTESWDDDWDENPEVFVNKTEQMRQKALANQEKPIFSVLNNHCPSEKKAHQQNRRQLFRSNEATSSVPGLPVGMTARGRGYQPRPVQPPPLMVPQRDVEPSSLSMYPALRDHKNDNQPGRNDGFVQVKSKSNRKPNTVGDTQDVFLGQKIANKKKPKP